MSYCNDDKHLVAMEQAQCPVCGVLHATGVLLQSRDITHPKLERVYTTHFGLCPQHKALEAEYIALLELKREPTPEENNLRGTWDLRTGQLLHVRRSVFARMFNTPMPEGPLCFMQVGVIARIEAMMKGQPDGEAEGGTES